MPPYITRTYKVIVHMKDGKRVRFEVNDISPKTQGHNLDVWVTTEGDAVSINELEIAHIEYDFVRPEAEAS